MQKCKQPGVSRRLKFIVKMLFLMILMLSVSIAIQVNYYTQFVLWGLFAYIIAREICVFWREEVAQDRDERLRQEIMDKLNRTIKDINSTV